jgi:hypothetical protein
MTIEGELIADEASEASLWAEVGRSPLEAHEAGLPAFVRVQLFPLENLLPGLLVHGVVDGHDGPHIIFLRVPSFTLHCVVEHLLGRINPSISFDALLMYWCEFSSWNGRNLAFLWQRDRLPKAGIPESTRRVSTKQAAFGEFKTHWLSPPAFILLRGSNIIIG